MTPHYFCLKDETHHHFYTSIAICHIERQCFSLQPRSQKNVKYRDSFHKCSIHISENRKYHHIIIFLSVSALLLWKQKVIGTFIVRK